MIPLVAKVMEQIRAESKFVSPDDSVFASRTGTPIDTHNELARTLKPILKDLGLPDISWHDLRHTASTFADKAGLTEAERQRILGQTDVKMTRHYTHAHAELVRGSMAKMGDRFDAAFSADDQLLRKMGIAEIEPTMGTMKTETELLTHLKKLRRSKKDQPKK